MNSLVYEAKKKSVINKLYIIYSKEKNSKAKVQVAIIYICTIECG